MAVFFTACKLWKILQGSSDKNGANVCMHWLAYFVSAAFQQQNDETQRLTNTLCPSSPRIVVIGSSHLGAANVEGLEQKSARTLCLLSRLIPFFNSRWSPAWSCRCLCCTGRCGRCRRRTVTSSTTEPGECSSHWRSRRRTGWLFNKETKYMLVFKWILLKTCLQEKDSLK